MCIRDREKIASELVVNLVFNFGSIFASEVVYALVAEQRIGIEMELPQLLIQDVESEPGSYHVAQRCTPRIGKEPGLQRLKA